MVRCFFLDMPTTIRGYTRANPDGSFTIAINAKMSSDVQRRCLRHELSHIERCDFEAADPDLVELALHKRGL